jgi:glycogen debranching enzyme
MWETRWASDPSVAQGSLLNFLEHQRSDGSLHGRIYTHHFKNTDFYHANWGDAVQAVDAVHKDDAFLQTCYRGLARYVGWLDRTRDSGVSGMYDVANHYETGQEYMSRYQAVDPNADVAGWQGDLRLKGIDITVYAYQLKRCLAQLASRLGHDGEVEMWNNGADRIASAILELMWNEDAGMFSDVDPRTGCRTEVKAAVCFYPLLTDLLSDEMVDRLLDHLGNPKEFASPFPVPSSSIDDAHFDSNASWKGKRHNCPWNGRTWPMTNSHIIEGLLRQWYSGRRSVGTLASDLLARFVRMMFFDGDPKRPNCFEHYNPTTGHPSSYRGIDDYQHSWVLDLLIRGVAGLEPRPDYILIDPLPIDVSEVQLFNALVRGKRVDIARRGQEIEVTVDDSTHKTTVGNPLKIQHG